VQPQIDVGTHAVYGYEALLRKSKQDGWTVPTSFLELSVAEQAKLIEATVIELGAKISNQFLAFNLNRVQFSDPTTLATIIAVYAEQQAGELLAHLNRIAPRLPG